MREILFRGKNVDTEEWIKGFYHHSDYVYNGKNVRRHYILPINAQDAIVVESATVGQYTGLTDKYGQKIFEGDIVRYAIYPPDKFVHGVVSYKDGTFRIGDQGCALCVCSADGIDEYRLEVIGNIHDKEIAFDRILLELPQDVWVR